MNVKTELFHDNFQNYKRYINSALVRETPQRFYERL